VINLAVEAVTPKSGTESGATVSDARVVTLTMTGASVNEGSSIDYPALSVSLVEAQGLSGAWIIKSLMSTRDGGALIGTFQSPNESQAFRNRGGVFDGIGSASCLHADVTELQQ
jgi:hypothetical protein